MIEPIELYLAGRDTDERRGKHIHVREVAVEACRDWLRKNFRGIDIDRDVRITSRLRPGSRELTEMFERGRGAPLAKDTSCGTGFAPMTDLERVVLAVE